MFLVVSATTAVMATIAPVAMGLMVELVVVARWRRAWWWRRLGSGDGVRADADTGGGLRADGGADFVPMAAADFVPMAADFVPMAADFSRWRRWTPCRRRRRTSCRWRRC